jgi:hypothetical protein
MLEEVDEAELPVERIAALDLGKAALEACSAVSILTGSPCSRREMVMRFTPIRSASVFRSGCSIYRSCQTPMTRMRSSSPSKSGALRV